MANISAFAGWRYNPENINVEQVVAPPYDVIDSELQKTLYARDPNNCIRMNSDVKWTGPRSHHESPPNS